MARPRSIQADEALQWLLVLLSYAYTENAAQRPALLDLWRIGYEATAYPDNISDWRLAELLLRWSEQYVPQEDWQRLQGRVRKRRNQA